jgi:WD40 repeat protein
MSPNGKSLASTGSDGNVRVWDIATGNARITLPVRQKGTGSVVISPDGRTMATFASSDGTVRLWDLASGHMLAALQAHGRHVASIAFSPDGKTLATGGQEGIVKVWDLAGRQVRATLDCKAWIGYLAFSPDGKTLASGSQFGRVILWDALTGQEKCVLEHEGLSEWAGTVAFSPDGKLLAATYNRGIIKIWDVHGWRLHASFKGHTAIVNGLSFFPDGKTLATGSADGTVRLWDVLTGQEKLTLQAVQNHKTLVTSVAITPDGKMLASGCSDGIVKLWRAATDPDAMASKTELDPNDPDSPIALLKLGDRLRGPGRFQEAETAYRQALARLQKLAAAFPGDPGYPHQLARACNNLAWLLATCSETRWRDVPRAVELSRSALHLEAKNGLHWNTLGVAYYRAGNWQATIEALKKSNELLNGEEQSFNAFFLAMAQWQLGDKEEAHKCYEQAVQWMEKNKPQDEELLRCRALRHGSM